MSFSSNLQFVCLRVPVRVFRGRFGRGGRSGDAAVGRLGWVRDGDWGRLAGGARLRIRSIAWYLYVGLSAICFAFYVCTCGILSPPRSVCVCARARGCDAFRGSRATRFQRLCPLHHSFDWQTRRLLPAGHRVPLSKSCPPLPAFQSGGATRGSPTPVRDGCACTFQRRHVHRNDPIARG